MVPDSSVLSGCFCRGLFQPCFVNRPRSFSRQSQQHQEWWLTALAVLCVTVLLLKDSVVESCFAFFFSGDWRKWSDCFSGDPSTQKRPQTWTQAHRASALPRARARPLPFLDGKTTFQDGHFVACSVLLLQARRKAANRGFLVLVTCRQAF